MRHARLLIVMTAALSFAAFLAACAPDAATAPTSDMAMDAAARLPGAAVQARTVTTGSLVGPIESSGLVRGIQEAWVIAETQGVVERVFVTLGDEVTEGAPLVAFDPTLQELQLRQAETQLESTQLDLAATERLHAGGNASTSDLARARSAAAGAQAAAEAAQRALAHRTVRAPIAGRVADKADDVSTGNYLTVGNRVARIIDTSRLQVELALGEREIGYVRRGSAAVVTVPACPAGPFDAQVVAIAAASDPATGAFPVIVEWPNLCGDAVRAGMSARVAIVPEEESTVVVPSTAILTRDGGHFVYVAEDGRARRQAVSVGRRSGNAVEVTDGLSVGTVIVTSGMSRISDGSEVTVTLVGETGAL